MTLNAMLGYLGMALFFFGAVFMLLAILRPRRRGHQDVEVPVEALEKRTAVNARRRADMYSAAILLAAAAITEIVGIARGGPAAGELSGNVLGAFLAIFFVAFVCLVGCLVARHFILARICRNADA